MVDSQLEAGVIVGYVLYWLLKSLLWLRSVEQ